MLDSVVVTKLCGRKLASNGPFSAFSRFAMDVQSIKTNGVFVVIDSTRLRVNNCTSVSFKAASYPERREAAGPFPGQRRTEDR